MMLHSEPFRANWTGKGSGWVLSAGERTLPHVVPVLVLEGPLRLVGGREQLAASRARGQQVGALATTEK